MDDRQTRIERHLPEEALDDRIAGTDDPELVQRLCFVKNLYAGDTLTEAARRVGRSQPTGSRWADRWNRGGVHGLAPDHGGGRPSKLDDEQRRALREAVEEVWSVPQLERLLEDEFGVTYSDGYLYELARSLEEGEGHRPADR